ncbi:MAG: hypothetical protein GY765_00190, partial [bacterium]|nr:hypothetical protein [bacterium]
MGTLPPYMKNPPTWIKLWIKKTLSDWHAAMIAIGVAAFVGGGCYAHVKKLWHPLNKTMQSG